MIAEIILIPEGLGLDAAKAGAQYVARGLSGIGMKVREQISLCPDTVQFQKAIATALARSNLVVTIGGMGRASGYLAKTVLSRGLGLELQENAQALEAIRGYCKRANERFEPQDSALALLPRGAVVFPPAYGKLPGCAISSTKQHIVMLPENKDEIAPMFNKYVAPYLGGAATATVTRTLRTYGTKEDDVLRALGDIMNLENPAVSLEREGNETLVRVASRGATTAAAAALCTPVLKNIVDKLGDSAYGLDVPSLEAAVAAKLEKKAASLAVAEGGTGGVFSRILSEAPGGSDVLTYMVMADSAQSKTEKLGIPKKLLKKHGNVGEYAAIAAANAVREKAGTPLAVAILANVGDDNTRICRKGDVYIAVASADTVYIKKLVVGDGDTDEYMIVDAAVSRALNMVRLAADYYPEPYTAAIPLQSALENPGVTELSDYEEAGAEPEAPPEDAPRRGLFENFIVRKADRRGVKVRKFIFILAMLVFLGSSGYIGLHYYQAYTARKQAEDLGNMFRFGNMEDVEVSPDYPKNYSLKFAGLWNVNNDVVAYVSIPGTELHYPIVQAADNDYYLRRDFYGKSNQYGIPFMDYRVDLKKPSDNLVIYGHNMKDGQIFGQLIPYNPIQYGSIGYYKDHPLIECTTVYKEKKYKIFSVFITNAYEEQGPVFAYHDFVDAKSKDDFNRYVEEVTKRSLINTTVDVKSGDELLTLSTCTYEFADARLVVVGRALRFGESEEVDVENASRNQSPLMPDIWYKTYGGNKPIGEETAQIVTSASVSPGSSASVSELPGSSGSISSAVSSLSTSSRSSATSDSIAALEAESRAASRRAEQSRLAAESSQAASAKAESDAAAAKAASEEAALKAASDARAEALRAAEEEASRRAEESSRRAEEAPQSEDWDADEDIVFGDDEIFAKVMFAKTTGAADDEKSDATLTVRANGKLYEDVGELEIIARVVQNEIGSTFHEEAIKAQAVAAYTFIKHANSGGSVPNVLLAPKVKRRVFNAVQDVLGEMVYYKGKIAFTPYHATSSGKTASSASVWGGSYPYLVPVDSEVDKTVENYRVITAISREKVERLLLDKLGIDPDGDPAKWFKILKRDEGGYVTALSVCGETKSASGAKLTGRLMRENVLGLRSSCFKVQYDSGRDAFLFATYGYGHGVGMSQNGANLYAHDGWSYIEILEHYYPGTTIE